MTEESLYLHETGYYVDRRTEGEHEILRVGFRFPSGKEEYGHVVAVTRSDDGPTPKAEYERLSYLCDALCHFLNSGGRRSHLRPVLTCLDPLPSITSYGELRAFIPPERSPEYALQLADNQVVLIAPGEGGYTEWFDSPDAFEQSFVEPE